MASLNQEERHLITIQGLDFFASGLASIFVTIFLFAHSDLRTTILFQLYVYTSLFVFFSLSGWTLRRFSSGTHMKIGIGVSAVFYLLLLLLQERVIQYLVPLAILNGFGGGMYWAAFNFNQYIFSNENKREQYFGYAGAVASFLSALSPFLGGIIITVAGSAFFHNTTMGYVALFFSVFLLLVFMILFVRKLPSHEAPIFSYRHLFAKNRSPGWTLVLWQNALLGLYDSVLPTVTGILFYLILKQEFWIGFTQTVGFVLGALGGLICVKLLEKQHLYFWLGSLGLTVAIGIFAFLQNIIGLWIFVVISGFTGPFLYTWISSMWFKAMDKATYHWRDKYHLLLERDIVLGISRIVSFLILYLYLAHGDQVVFARHWLIILPLLPLALGALSQLNETKRL